MTWLPYPNMRLSVHTLSALTLGRQVADCISILRIVAGHREGGRNKYSDTVLSWHHHPEALVLYTDYAVQELLLRGHTNTLPSPRSTEGRKLYQIPLEWIQKSPKIPEWIGVERIHASHRATLLAKDPVWYSQFSWTEPAVRSLQLPGKMPRPGDTVIGPSGEVHMVHSLDSMRRPVLITDSGLVPVERVEFYNRRWLRAVVVE